MVVLSNYADTNGYLEVSSRIGFKFTWEKEDIGNKASKIFAENCASETKDVMEVRILTRHMGFPASSSRSL